jgi:hypothetical protein
VAPASVFLTSQKQTWRVTDEESQKAAQKSKPVPGQRMRLLASSSKILKWATQDSNNGNNPRENRRLPQIAMQSTTRAAQN